MVGAMKIYVGHSLFCPRTAHLTWETFGGVERVDNARTWVLPKTLENYLHPSAHPTIEAASTQASQRKSIVNTHMPKWPYAMLPTSSFIPVQWHRSRMQRLFHHLPRQCIFKAGLKIGRRDLQNLEHFRNIPRSDHGRWYATDGGNFADLPEDVGIFSTTTPFEGQEAAQVNNNLGWKRRYDNEVLRRENAKFNDIQEQAAATVQTGRIASELLAWTMVTESDGKSPLKDITYYTADKDYPRREQYPNLPDDLFLRPPASQLGALIHAFAPIDIKIQTHNEIVKSPESVFRRTTLEVKNLGAELIAIGEGPDIGQSSIAANSHLLIQLHKDGHLKYFGLRTSHAPHKYIIPPKALELDPDAKLHVYNFAAHFLAFPSIKVERASENHFIGTIQLESPDIVVSAAADSEEGAELAVCIAFKQHAESRNMQNGFQQLSLREPNSLNLDNAGNVLSLYEFEQNRGKFKFLSKSIPSNLGKKRWSVSVVHDNKWFAGPIVMRTCVQAKMVARLAAAVKVIKDDPNLLERYLDYSRQGCIPRIISPPNLSTSSESTEFLKRSLDLATFVLPDSQTAGAVNDQSVLGYHILKPTASPFLTREYVHSTTMSLHARSEWLKRRQDAFHKSPSYHQSRGAMLDLPVNQHRSQILDMINNAPYSIVTGATGTGKSTLLPQMILEEAIEKGNGASCNIICTQPRRIAAISLAHRVANDRQEAVGEVVGYHIGGELNFSRLGGSITFCTPEIAAHQLSHTKDEFLRGISHIIIDEIHERNAGTDKLLSWLKRTVHHRIEEGYKAPKVILMSATADVDLYSNYFNMSNGSDDRPPLLAVPGRLYSIEKTYLSDIMEELQQSFSSPTLKAMLSASHTLRYINSETKDLSNLARNSTKTDQTPPIIDWRSQYEIERDDLGPLFSRHLVAAKISQLLHSTSSGSILAFLPGWREILEVEELLQEPGFGNIDFSGSSRYKVVLLHSENSSALDTAFESVPPNTRRVILATNIAETSITLPDVKYVVDAGKQRTPQWINEQISKLQLTWASKSSMTQRAGRAGRVQPGSYYALFSKQRHHLVPSTTPAQLLFQSEVQVMCLRSKIAFPNVPIQECLEKSVEPLPEALVENAVRELKATNALTDSEDLTRFGLTVARFGTGPSTVRMIILATIFRCLEPILIVAALRHKHTLFANAMRKSDQEAIRTVRRKYAEGTNSDHMAEVNAFLDLKKIQRNDGTEAARDYAAHQGLQYEAFIATQKEVGRLLRVADRVGLLFDKQSALNSRSHDNAVIKAVILSGFPLAVHNSGYRFCTAKGVDSTLAEYSATCPVDWRPGSWHPNPLKGTICAYSNLVSMSRISGQTFLRDTTPVSALAAALFSRSLATKEGSKGILMVDNWLPLTVSDHRSVDLLLQLRRVWDSFSTAAIHGHSPRRRYRGKMVRDDRALELVSQIIVDLLQDAERRASDDTTEV